MSSTWLLPLPRPSVSPPNRNLLESKRLLVLLRRPDLPRRPLLLKLHVSLPSKRLLESPRRKDLLKRPELPRKPD